MQKRCTLILIALLSFLSPVASALQGPTTTYGNLSVGKFYQFSRITSPTYPDLWENQFTDGTKLTDEELAVDWPLDKWVAWYGSTSFTTEITLDLGKNYSLDQIKCHLASRTDWGIYYPDSVDLYTQTDGSATWIKYGSTITAPADTADYSTTWLSGDGGQTVARFIKYSIQAGGGEHIFLDEIEVHGQIVNSWRNVPDWGCYNAACVSNTGDWFIDIPRHEQLSNGKKISMLLWYVEMNPAQGALTFSQSIGWIWRKLDDNISTCRYFTFGWLPAQITAEDISQGSGTFDEYLEQWFTDSLNSALRENNTDPIWIRPMNEMNGGWTFPGSVNSSLKYGGDPLNYRRAWRRIYNIAEQVGAADKHIFLWAPNGYTYDGVEHMPPNYYPGDQYVDWVGVSVYPQGDTPYPSNILNGTAGPGSFDFNSSWTHKPLMIAEGGWNHNVNTDGVTWINDWFDIKDNFPRIKAAAWFNHGAHSNFNIEFYPDEVKQAFAARVQDPYFLARPHAGILDYNNDHFINLIDTAELAEDWLTGTPSNMNCDINGDDLVNASDLKILLEFWLN